MIAGPAGMTQLKQFLMVNIKKGGLKGERVRPQSIRPLIKFPRGISDRVISSCSNSTELAQRAPGLGLKRQAIEETVPHNDIEEASSIKLQAPGVKLSNQPVQASGGKRQAPGSKLQASSHKLQAP